MPVSPPIVDPCPICGGQVTLHLAERDVRIGKRTVSVRAELPECLACGEVLLSPVELDNMQRRAADAIRKQEGLLPPAEVLAIRQKLQLTQAQLETLIGAGPKTVARWERGTVFQNGATDTLLRILGAVPAAVHYAAQLRGVPVTPFSRTRHFAQRIPANSEPRNYQYEEKSKSASVVRLSKAGVAGAAPVPATADVKVPKEAIG